MNLLRSMPGSMISRNDNQFDILTQRSPQNYNVSLCRVAVSVNASALREPTVNDLNAYLRPNQLLGIEAYDAGAAPVAFSRRNRCGLVVIWPK